MEGDSSVVIGWGLGLSPSSWKYAHLIHERRDLIVVFDARLSHVPKSKNGLVDKIAKWGVLLPNVVRSNVLPDLLG